MNGRIPLVRGTEVGALDNDGFYTILAGVFPSLKPNSPSLAELEELEEEEVISKREDGGPPQRCDYEWGTHTFVPTEVVRRFADMAPVGTELKITSWGRKLPKKDPSDETEDEVPANPMTLTCTVKEKNRLASGRITTKTMTATNNLHVPWMAGNFTYDEVLSIQQRTPFSLNGESCGTTPGMNIGEIDDFGYQTLLVGDGLSPDLLSIKACVSATEAAEWFDCCLPGSEVRLLLKKPVLSDPTDEGSDGNPTGEYIMEEMIASLAPQMNLAPTFSKNTKPAPRKIDVANYSNANKLSRIVPPYDQIALLAAREASPGLRDHKYEANAKLLYGLRGVRDSGGGMEMHQPPPTSSSRSSASNSHRGDRTRSARSSGSSKKGNATDPADLRYEYRSMIPITASQRSRNVVSSSSPSTRVGETTLVAGGIQQAATTQGSVGTSNSVAPPSNMATQGSADSGSLANPPGSSSFEDKYNRGNWQIFQNEILGRGGFGEVYKAFNTDTGSFAAAKLLKGIVGDPHEMAKLVKELQLEIDMLTALAHNNVVKVFEGDTATVPPCIFLEWMPGGSVSTVMHSVGGTLPPNVVAKYTRDALLGLQFLHEKKVLHRDLKPGNMLVGAQGDVKLSDFGLCKKIVSSGSKSSAQGIGGGIVGTVPYLAPECLRGKMSRESDVWAIGCSIVEMVSGEIPWKLNNDVDCDNSMALIFAIGTAKPPEHHPKLPNGINAETHPELLDFLGKCFAFDPNERPSCTSLLQHPFVQV